MPDPSETQLDHEGETAACTKRPPRQTVHLETDIGNEACILEGAPPPRQPAARDELVARADDIKSRCGRVFNLYSANSPMRKARQSLLAVLIAAGANRARTEEVAGILRSTPENVRSLMRRAEKDGWVIREGPADWVLAPGVKTDFVRLAAAEILNTAAEQWPQNPAWLQATDRLYGHH